MARDVATGLLGIATDTTLETPLRKQAASGVAWTSVAAVITSGLQAIRLAVLARLLDPGDFGLMTMVWLVIGFAQMFEDMGVSKAMVRLRSATREQLSSLYWLNVMAGVGIFAVIVSLSPLIGGLFREPRVVALVPWAALVFLISPLGQQFQMLLQRDLRFAQLAIVETLATAAGTIASVGCAVAGLGVFSLIWGHLLEKSTSTLLLGGLGWVKWRPKLHFRWQDVRSCVAFGSYQMADRSLGYFTSNLDFFFIGRFLGPSILAVYVLAYQVVTMPLGRINPILNRVAFPMFAKMQDDDEALCRGFLAVTRALAFVVVPISVGLAVTAPLIVRLAFGSRWSDAIPLIQILALLGLLKALVNPGGAIVLAKGRADVGFKWEVLAIFVIAPVFWSVVGYGSQAIAWAYVGWCLVEFVFGWVILRAVIGLDGREYLSVLLRPMAAGGLMGVVVQLTYVLLARFALSDLVMLIGLVVVGIGVYGASCRRYVRELWMLVSGRGTSVV